MQNAKRKGFALLGFLATFSFLLSGMGCGKKEETPPPAGEKAASPTDDDNKSAMPGGGPKTK